MKLDPQVCVFREGTVPVEFGTTLGFRHPLGDLRPSTPWIRGATVVLLLLRTVAFLWPEILQTSVDCFLLCILLDFTFSQLKKNLANSLFLEQRARFPFMPSLPFPPVPPAPKCLTVGVTSFWSFGTSRSVWQLLDSHGWFWSLNS